VKDDFILFVFCYGMLLIRAAVFVLIAAVLDRTRWFVVVLDADCFSDKLHKNREGLPDGRTPGGSAPQLILQLNLPTPGTRRSGQIGLKFRARSSKNSRSMGNFFQKILPTGHSAPRCCLFDYNGLLPF